MCANDMRDHCLFDSTVDAWRWWRPSSLRCVAVKAGRRPIANPANRPTDVCFRGPSGRELDGRWRSGDDRSGPFSSARAAPTSRITDPAGETRKGKPLKTSSSRREWGRKKTTVRALSSKKCKATAPSHPLCRHTLSDPVRKCRERRLVCKQRLVLQDEVASCRSNGGVCDHDLAARQIGRQHRLDCHCKAKPCGRRLDGKSDAFETAAAWIGTELNPAWSSQRRQSSGLGLACNSGTLAKSARPHFSQRGARTGTVEIGPSPPTTTVCCWYLQLRFSDCPRMASRSSRSGRCLK